MKKVPVILVGCGKMGMNHLRVIHENMNFELLGVVDPKLKELPHPYTSYKIFKNLDEAISLPFKAAFVASNTEEHFSIGMKLAENKKHFLMEKPVTKTTEQAYLLSETVKKNNVIARVGFLERLNPAVLKMKEILDSGFLGKPIHFSFTRVGGYPQLATTENNVLIDLAVHDLDVLQFLVGKFDIVSSIGHYSWREGILDTAEILLQNEVGISSSIHVNWITPTKIRNVRITGTRGVCFVDYILQNCYMLGGDLLRSQTDVNTDFNSFVKSYQNSDRIEFGIVHSEPLKLQLNQFLKELEGQQNLCTIDAAIETLKTAEDSYFRIKNKNK
jgi:UDP-N-acetylglucosamine 3-dehydrogenase